MAFRVADLGPCKWSLGGSVMWVSSEGNSNRRQFSKSSIIAWIYDSKLTWRQDMSKLFVCSPEVKCTGISFLLGRHYLPAICEQSFAWHQEWLTEKVSKKQTSTMSRKSIENHRESTWTYIKHHQQKHQMIIKKSSAENLLPRRKALAMVGQQPHSAVPWRKSLFGALEATHFGYKA